MLLNPLRQAIAEHRPDVRLLVRSRNNVADHRADAAALAELGVTIAADSGTHAKGVIADGRHGALFSANLDAAHGLFGGVEMGVRLDGRPALAEANRYLSHVIDHADRRFEPAPTQRQLATGLHAAWQARWPRPTRWRVVADDADWAALTDATRTGPVLWEEDGHLRLYAGTRGFHLRRGADGQPRLEVRPAEVDARDRMVRWYDRRPANGKRIARGICPAIVERVPLPTAPR
jgi:phosphatidylserine/phosphatidylglycerophosphate/cardiolipin synthase-like enzyme